ncbi:MAG TPA: fibronectin type III domain-containing protein [Solirubrobacteraceae bacterium]|nr:fibronectin type III domain-containing protein [Solirubrobacteraceae bacterium]
MNARRLILALLVAAVAVSCQVDAALAAPPEAPGTLYPEHISGTHALLAGVIDPGLTGGPGTFEFGSYKFLYKASATECEGGAATIEGLSWGEGQQHVAQEVAGLEPETKYSVCLVAKNGSEETVGSPITFFTSPSEAPETGAATEVGGMTAKLTGVLFPHHAGKGPVSYWFQYWQSATECEHEAEFYGSIYHLYETVGEGEGTGKQGEVVTATAAGLLPHATYTFCLVASEPGEGRGDAVQGVPVTFTTETIAPIVSGEESPSIGSVEATVAGDIDAGGLPTSYRVEYGTTGAYGSSSETASAGSGNVPVNARVRLSGLRPSTEYHYRFVSQNERGTATGPDQTLITTAAAGATVSVLPDNRAYELVSSPQEDVTVDSLSGSDHGIPRNESDENSYQPDRAAADGNAIAYPGNPSLESGSGAFADDQSNEWVATRSSTGWTTSDITPAGADAYAEYSYFSNDLSLGILFADSGVEIPASPLAPVGCHWNIYSRTADSVLHSLIPQALGAECGNPSAAYPSADGSHVLFQDEAALTTGANRGRLNLYDAAGGALYQVNILPDGQPESSPYAWLGGAPVQDEGYQAPNFSNAVSSDGARIFWTSTEALAGEVTVAKGLYVRENDTQPQSPIGPGGECTDAADACTVQIDRAEAKCLGEGKCSSGGGVFQTATPDGSKVFFTDAHRLTADATAEPEEPDLYEYDVETGALTDLTVDAAGHANVQGLIGASENGEYVYFAAEGVLAANTAADGETAQKANEAGEPSIYVRHGGVTTFIASGNVSYLALWNERFTDWAHSISNRTAEVTPDGQNMVFESNKELTGYDNREGGSGESEAEVFVYDASTGRLSCSSCNPTGGSPSQGVSSLSKLPVPGSGPKRVETYQERLISESGSRVFFETGQPLVPQDTNGLEDVYEWERPADASEANNSCTTSSPSYSAVNGGCVYLISGGQDADGSYIADADAEGNNLFFTSREDLTPSAGDNEAVAMYDARVDGGFPELKTACTGTGCQGVPPAPPIFATPASVTYAGVGNFEPQPATSRQAVKPKQAKCKRGEVRKASRCVKQKKKKRSKQAKRSSKRSKRRKK